MKKIIISLLLTIFAIGRLQAQETSVNFQLQQDGTFLTEKGDTYQVIEFDGLSAHEIYQKLCTNAAGIYNNPNAVLSKVEDSSIKVRAIANDLVMGKIKVWSHDAYYQLHFKIKDGRVRIEAPLIENELIPLGARDQTSCWWPKYAAKWLKDEKSREKNITRILRVEIEMNGIINAILGTNVSKQQQDEDDNW